MQHYIRVINRKFSTPCNKKKGKNEISGDY